LLLLCSFLVCFCFCFALFWFASFFALERFEKAYDTLFHIFSLFSVRGSLRKLAVVWFGGGFCSDSNGALMVTQREE